MEVSVILSHIDSHDMNTVMENFLLSSLLNTMVVKSTSHDRISSHTYRRTVCPKCPYL